MKNQRDKVKQYQRRVTVITNREREIAKECLKNGDKRRALLALRRKKYQESLLAKTDSQLAQLEILTNDVEFALVQKDVVFGLQQGAKVLKEIHKEVGGIESVEKLMGENEEALSYQRVCVHNAIVPSAFVLLTWSMICAKVMQEINEMLSSRMTNQEEDEVEDELDALQSEVAKVTLPDAPTAALPRNEKAETKTAKERAQRRAEDAEATRTAEPMLA